MRLILSAVSAVMFALLAVAATTVSLWFALLFFLLASAHLTSAATLAMRRWGVGE